VTVPAYATMPTVPGAHSIQLSISATVNEDTGTVTYGNWTLPSTGEDASKNNTDSIYALRPDVDPSEHPAIRIIATGGKAGTNIGEDSITLDPPFETTQFPANLTENDVNTCN